MVVDKNRTDDHKFILNGEELKEAKSFVYLGSLINTEVSCMPEVNWRLWMARSRIENMTKNWKSQAICKSLKLRIARATAFAVATYGCESWAYSKKVTKKIEAFETWTYRRLLRVSWRQHKTNALNIEQLRTKPMLVKQNRKRKMKHFGHIIRHNSLENTIIQGITAVKTGNWETCNNLGEIHRGMGEGKHWWSKQNGRGEGSVVHCDRRHSSSTLSHVNRERHTIYIYLFIYLSFICLHAQSRTHSYKRFQWHVSKSLILIRGGPTRTQASHLAAATEWTV